MIEIKDLANDMGLSWSALTIWAVVNAVNVLQAAGFLSRVPGGSLSVNQILGYVIIGLAIPSVVALSAFIRDGVGWLQMAGPVVFLAFILLMVVVDYAWPIEFRSPKRNSILIPYLVLFFSSIVLMGLPMFRLNRSLWLVTVATTVLLVGAMGIAMRRGVG